MEQYITRQQIEEWKAIWREYKDKITPNRKTGSQLIDFLKDNYNVIELSDPKAKNVVMQNILQNEIFAVRLPEGKMPLVSTYIINEEPQQIFVGIDQISGYYLVEGSESLRDRLCCYQGLDEMDLENYYVVANYVSCLKQANLLSNINK